MKAYVTLLSTNNYLDGVLALHQSLLNTNTKYPFYACITSNITPDIRECLTKAGISIIELPDFAYNEKCKKIFKKKNMPHWFYTSAKIEIYGLIQFEKIVYLDSDTLVLKNIDDLFEKEDGSAAEDSPMVYEEEGHFLLNSGILVIVPEKKKEKQLKKLSEQFLEPDQNLIRRLYPNWKEKKELHLPQGYNIHVLFMEKYLKRGIHPKDFYVLHFIGETKPFMKYYNPLKGKRTHAEEYEKLYMETLFQAQKRIETKS